MSTRQRPANSIDQEKLLEIYFNKLNRRPTPTLIARHEAAHAIMHYLVGLPPTRLTASDDRGLCESSGRAADIRQQVLALLAGIAYEVKYSAWLIDLHNSKTADLEQARQLLASNASGRRAEVKRKICTVGVEKALRLAMERACDILEPFNGEIESLGLLLVTAGQLSARRTGAFMRQHIGQDRRLEKQQWQLPLGLPTRSVMA